jgi:hypothetical protein
MEGTITVEYTVDSGWGTNAYILNLPTTGLASTTEADPGSSSTKFTWTAYQVLGDNQKVHINADKFFNSTNPMFCTDFVEQPIKVKARAVVTPPDKTPPPVAKPAGAPAARMAVPSIAADPGFCLCFPHQGSVAAYSQPSGLLAFGPVTTPVLMRVRMYQYGSLANPKFGQPIQMQGEYWIVQFLKSNGYTGHVLAVVENALTGKSVAPDFTILY